MAEAREVWITGLGIVSCLGEGIEAHWEGLSKPSSADTTAFAPYVVHRAVSVDFDKQIPKKGDQRQMEAWQRYGVYAAGLARFNLARTSMRTGDAAAAREAVVASVHLLEPGQLNTYDVLISDDVVFTEGALEAFLAGPAKGKSAKGAATDTEAAETDAVETDAVETETAAVSVEKGDK